MSFEYTKAKVVKLYPSKLKKHKMWTVAVFDEHDKIHKRMYQEQVWYFESWEDAQKKAFSTAKELYLPRIVDTGNTIITRERNEHKNDNTVSTL